MKKPVVILISSVAALSLISLAAAFFTNRELPQSKTCALTEIYNGNTVNIVCLGDSQKVKLCGVDVADENQPKAKELVSSLVGNIETISVLFSGSAAEIFVPTSNPNQEKMLSGELLLAGLGKFNSQDNCPNSVSLQTAEDIAKRNRVGVWK